MDKFTDGRVLLGDALHGRNSLQWRPDHQKQVALNDFVAQAWALNIPEIRENCLSIIKGESRREHGCAILGSGTGLGVAKLDRKKGDDSQFIPSPSEGGNAPFPVDYFSIEQRSGFLPWLEKKINGKSRSDRSVDLVPLRIEHVVSGRGLELIYEFLHNKKLAISKIDDAIKAHDKKALGAADLFGEYLGRVARTHAINFCAWGGLFFSGGVLQRNPQLINRNSFRDAFLAAPTKAHQAELEKTPISLMLNDKIGLWGAAAYGMHIAEQS